MRILRNISNFIIYSNIFIALGGASLCWQTYFLLNRPPQYLYIVLAFLATLFIYNIDRLLSFKSISGVKSERHIWITQNAKILLSITVLCALALAAMVFFLPWKIIFFLAHLGFLSVGYSLPFLGKGKNRRSLRSIKSLKIFLITYVWMAATAWLPLLSTDVSFWDADAQLIAIKRALFIFAVTLPFDIRDYHSDIKTQVSTLPHILGIEGTRWLAMFCIAGFGAIAYLQFYNYWQAFYALEITTIVSAVLILFSSPQRHEYYYAAAMDGTLILQTALLLFFHMLG